MKVLVPILIGLLVMGCRKKEAGSPIIEIAICKDNENGIHKDWGIGKNVQFRGESADSLDKFVGEHVLKVMKKK